MKPTLVEPHSPNGYVKVPFDTSGPPRQTLATSFTKRKTRIKVSSRLKIELVFTPYYGQITANESRGSGWGKRGGNVSLFFIFTDH